jgi:hypothetical protein
LDAAVGGEEAAATSVKGGVVFEDGDGGLNGVNCGAPEGEDGVAGFERGADACFMSGAGVGGNGPGAAVDEQGRIVCGWDGHGIHGRTWRREVEQMSTHDACLARHKRLKTGGLRNCVLSAAHP